MSALRIQLVPLVLVNVVRDVYLEAQRSSGQPMARHEERLFCRLERPLAKCFAMVEKSSYSKKWEAISREVEAIQGLINQAWDGEDVDSAELFSALLSLVADTHHQMPSGEKRYWWGKLLEALQAVYELVDPDLNENEKIERGAALGERMRAVIWNGGRAA